MPVFVVDQYLMMNVLGHDELGIALSPRKMSLNLMLATHAIPNAPIRTHHANFLAAQFVIPSFTLVFSCQPIFLNLEVKVKNPCTYHDKQPSDLSWL